MEERLIKMAAIGAAHGVNGEVRVKCFTAEPMSLGRYGALRSEDGRVFEIERLRPAKGTVVVAKFHGVDDRSAAEALNGLSLHVERSALPGLPEDEFYHADLIGLSAVDPAGEALGTVTAVHDFGAGDMLEIASHGSRPLLVPFTKAAVPDVDIRGRYITVIPPVEVEGELQDPAKEDPA